VFVEYLSHSTGTMMRSRTFVVHDQMKDADVWKPGFQKAVRLADPVGVHVLSPIRPAQSETLDLNCRCQVQVKLTHFVRDYDHVDITGLSKPGGLRNQKSRTASGGKRGGV
jgi:hypothetical protein